MLRLLSIEFHKLKYNKASKVLSIIYFGLLTATSLIASIEFNFAGQEIHLADWGIFNFPFIWHFNTYVASVLKFFLLLVIVSMMSNEYSNKTLKQNLIDGLSKKEFVLSKFYTVLAFSAVSTFFVFVVSLILGYLYSDYNELAIVFSDLEYLFAFFLKLTCFFSFGLFLGVLVKRSAFAIGALLVWYLAEWCLFFIAKWLFVSTWDDAFYLKGFLPLEATSNLIQNPAPRLGPVKTMVNQIGESFSNNFDVAPLTVLTVLFWTFIFVYSSHKLIVKRDL